MSVRLFHRRSSTTREKIQAQNGLSPANILRLQALGAPTAALRLQGLGASATGLRVQSLGVCSHRDSLGVNRPRSQSLFPGSPNCLGIPARSRSLSFSGASRGAENTLTASEEEHIFQCYTRVMYIMLGGLAAVVLGLVFYGIRNFSTLS